MTASVAPGAFSRVFAVAAMVADQRKENLVAKYTQANQWGRQSGPTPQQAEAHAKGLAEKQPQQASKNQK